MSLFIKFYFTSSMLNMFRTLKQSLCVYAAQYRTHTHSQAPSASTQYDMLPQHPLNAANWISDCFKRDFREESVAP